MKVFQTAIFRKQIKKLHDNQKQQLDEAVKIIVNEPQIGNMKKGDLSSVRVYKFRMTNQLTLLAYKTDIDEITLVSVGSHENFYRDIKH